MDKYVLSNVANCTFTFSDGEKSSVASSPNKEIVVVKLIPRTSTDKLFQEYIVRVFSSCKNAAELAKRCGYNCQKTFTRHFKKSFGELLTNGCLIVKWRRFGCSYSIQIYR